MLSVALFLVAQAGDPSVGLPAEVVKQAIQVGTSLNDESFARRTCIPLKKKESFSTAGGTIGCYTTPFTRVMAAAARAKREYRDFTASDVTADLVAPEVHVHGFALGLGGASMASVVTIVVTPRGSRDVGSAIRPNSMAEKTAEYANAYGATAQGTSKVAVFPLTVVDDKNEVHVVYDLLTPMGCRDCAAPFRSAITR